MLTVVCVKWGTKYTSDDVNRLKGMVEKNLSVPYRFVCYTDDPTGCECDTIPITGDLPHVWNKLSLFDMFDEHVLYFDLDVVIQQNVDELITDDFNLVWAYWKDTEDMKYNSSIMSWYGRDNKWILDMLTPEDIKEHHGIDRFMFANGVKANHWDQNLYYSRLHGPGKLESVKNTNPDLPWDETKVYYNSTCSVCLFNGLTTENMYDRYHRYY